jgi:hypothetical protein
MLEFRESKVVISQRVFVVWLPQLQTVISPN